MGGVDLYYYLTISILFVLYGLGFPVYVEIILLIAVLLFMLIATIAATATWKWITSEGFSSTSRMLKREAYQSSIAGIENARSWMTYHANDVGALIKQYIDGGNTPINLDAQLKPLQRAGQNYHVWLTGVNVEGTTYKLKVYSSGNARGSAKHNEVAIFNVDGLYRINIPEEHIHRAIDFDYNYFGGSTTNHGDIFARSMLVNGDLLDGNPASIDSNLVVTGNFKVSGNSIAVNGTACIGGNLNADNGLVGNNIYVDGDLQNLINVMTDSANLTDQYRNVRAGCFHHLLACDSHPHKCSGSEPRLSCFLCQLVILVLSESDLESAVSFCHYSSSLSK